MYSYKNGNYSVLIMSNGTKIRQTNEDEFIPSFAENVDVALTEKCSQKCPFCYMGCTPDGKHGDIFKYFFIDTLHPYTEIALNGNDLDHPELEKFLIFLKDKKVFANITVNQNQFFNNYEKLKDWSKKKLVHGIGVSLNKVTNELIEKINCVPNTVLHTIVGILNENDIESLKDKNVKVLILGYKKLERGISYIDKHENIIKENTEYLKNNIKDLVEHFNVVSFDNLAIEQLNIKSILSEEQWESFYMGDDGRFTFFIDLVNGVFAKNSISDKKYPIDNKSMDEMFEYIQTHKND